LAEEINGTAVGKLAQICKDLGIILVHYSSDYVFKGDNPAGYDEDSFTDPVDKYGETKVLGEKLLKSTTDKFYLIRLSRLFGKAGESEMAKKSFVDVMLDLVINKGKTELDLVDDEKSCPTYSYDLAKLTRHLVEKQLPFGIYHGVNSGLVLGMSSHLKFLKLEIYR
jgi:dTDP-4-dehydrorhamnose reductase